MSAEVFGEIPLLGLVKDVLYSRIPSSLNILNIDGTKSLGGLLSVVTDGRKKPILFFPLHLEDYTMPSEAQTTPLVWLGTLKAQC